MAGTYDDELDEQVARLADRTVEQVRSARLASKTIDDAVDAWLTDRLLRGPGKSRSNKTVERLGKPCPEILVEYYTCKAFNFAILPRDLVSGQAEDQPADTFLAIANALEVEADHRERLEDVLNRKMSAHRKG